MAEAIPELTHAEKAEWFKKTAEDPRIRAEYAASRAAVIQFQLEVQSTIRSIFQTELLTAGASARYDVPFADIDCVYLMPQVGGIPTVQVEAAEMYVDTFGLDGGVEYQEDVARDGRYPIGERATFMLKNKFIGMEELAGWALIKTHAANLTAAQMINGFHNDGTAGSGTGDGFLNIYTINEVITVADLIGVGGRKVSDIYVSPRRFNDLRSMVTMQALPWDMRNQLWNDGQGDANPAAIRIHKVWNSTLVDNNHGYCFTVKDGYTYGVMPIRQNLVTRDNPIAMLERKIGIMGYERLGMGILDTLGLIQITF